MANGDKNDKNNDDDDQAEIDAILIEIDYPATRDDLVEAAKDADAADTVIVLFQGLPDEEYTDRKAVDNAIDRSRGDQDRS
jgi:hypothetical protein